MSFCGKMLWYGCCQAEQELRAGSVLSSVAEPLCLHEMKVLSWGVCDYLLGARCTSCRIRAATAISCCLEPRGLLWQKIMHSHFIVSSHIWLDCETAIELVMKLSSLGKLQIVQDQLHISLTSQTIKRITNLPCVPCTGSLQALGL